MSAIKMHGNSTEMRDLCTRICRDYLHGAWKNVTPQNIGFKHISGGLSNWLYHVWLPDNLQDKVSPGTGPKEVLLRVYGQLHGEQALEALLTESVIFTLLSERGLGPRLHGIFPGGRIEQYINARPLKTKELANPVFFKQIATKMSQIHTMQVPLNKEPTWLWDTMSRWLVTCQKKITCDKNQLSPEIPGQAEFIRNLNLAGELSWLKKFVAANPSPVVFCHNDFQEGNILVSNNYNNNGNPEIFIIDFEYCSYNYRGFDMANHMLEWTYNYTEPKSPFYKECPENYPTEQQRLKFIEIYLSVAGLDENPEKLMKEIKVYSLASHLFWSLWAIVNAGSSQIPFGYWEYAASRLRAYQNVKTELLRETSNVHKRKNQETTGDLQ